MKDQREQRILSVLHKRQPGITILLENVFDPHNISAVMRTCDSVGINTIHTLFTQKPPHNHTGFRSSAGTWKWMKVEEHQHPEECIEALKMQYGRVFAAHMAPDALSIFDVDFTKPVAIAFGNEQNGCSPALLDLCDGTISIPQVGLVQSLNISVACAITLYEAYRQKSNAGHYNQPSLPESEIKKIFEEWTDFKTIREKKQRKP